MSRFEFKLPDIGEGVTEGEIVGWLVKVGDAVSEGQDMVEVMTDKATVTISAPRAGKVVELRGSEGDVIPVGSVLVVFETNGAAARPEAAGQSAQRAATANLAGQSARGAATANETGAEAPRVKAPAEAPRPVGQPARSAAPANEREMRAVPSPESDARPPAAQRIDGGRGTAQPQAARPERTVEHAATAVGDLREELPGILPAKPATDDYYTDRPLAAPATRKLARELGVDLRRIAPTGPGGRITREDVLHHQGDGVQHLEVEVPPSREVYEKAVPSRPPPAPPRLSPVAPAEAEQRVPIRGLRKRIYENMARSKHTAAHFTYVDECDAGALKDLRQRTKKYAEEQGTQLSFLPFIVKAVVASLRRHPALNCLVDDTTQEMVLRRTYDIGIAVATDAGLTVPVLRGADRLTLIEIAREIERLGSEARTGKIRREDLGGSSFTITSLGKVGGLFATPVVNYPEVAILGVHEMKKKPVVRGDQIVIGDVMLLSLSFDHRIIDGHVGAAFAQEVIRYLQEPERLLVEMC